MNSIITKKRRQGFTLTELMMATGVMALVMAGSFGVYITCQKLWYSISLDTRVSNKTSTALAKMVYGVKYNPYFPGIRAAEYNSISLETSTTNWVITYSTPDTTNNIFFYNKPDQTIYFKPAGPGAPEVVGTSIVASEVITNDYGLTISISLALRDGRFCTTNEMRTFISYRN
jgi:prepilin-type N-terminal cleavage/methylation domain-containing protein